MLMCTPKSTTIFPFSCERDDCAERICKHPEHFLHPEWRIARLAREGICDDVECAQCPCTRGHPRFECAPSTSAEHKYTRVTMFVTSCFGACRTMGFKIHLFRPSNLNTFCFVCKMNQGEGEIIGMNIVGGIEHFSYACIDCFLLLCSELPDLECI